MQIGTGIVNGGWRTQKHSAAFNNARVKYLDVKNLEAKNLGRKVLTNELGHGSEMHCQCIGKCEYVGISSKRR